MPPKREEPSTEPPLGKMRPLAPSPPTSAEPSPKLLSTRQLPRLKGLDTETTPGPPQSLKALPELPSEARDLRILDFDIENRPLNYAGQDFTNAEITAIAWGWTDLDHIACAAIGAETSPERMLSYFRDSYERADIVTGHFIRKHDLPIINGALLEFGLPPLTAKLTSDTYLDLVKRKDISASQENLGRMLGLEAPKVGMSQVDWREANRLTPGGIAKTKERVIGDVRQHKQLRLELIARGLLKPPKVWRP